MRLKQIFPKTEEEKILARVLLKLRVAVKIKEAIFVNEEKIRLRNTSEVIDPDCIVLEDFENNFRKTPSISLKNLLYREN